MQKSLLALALVSVTAVAGCMQTQDARNATTGAAIGCLAGEIIHRGDCVTGAALGAAGGALANDF